VLLPEQDAKDGKAVAPAVRQGVWLISYPEKRPSLFWRGTKGSLARRQAERAAGCCCWCRF